MIIIFNAYNERYENYKFGINDNVEIKEIFNTNYEKYNGDGIVNKNLIRAKEDNFRNYDYSLEIDLPAYTAIIFSVKKLEPIIKR